MIRLVAAIVLLAAASTVAAQTATAREPAARQFEAGRTAEFNQWLWRARQGVQPTESERALQAVADAVARQDCPAAVAALNAGLTKGLADVVLLAGAMFEDGTCVRQNWDRAVALYQRAGDAGHPSAAARLAAGSAAPVGGSDKAAALWWAAKARTPLPADCALPASDDPERFVAPLKGWPADRLAACVQAAALMATLQAEASTPGLASAFGLSGALQVTLLPGERRFEFAADIADDPRITGRIADATTDDRTRRQRALIDHLQSVADGAFKRYPGPAAIPSGWRVLARFDFVPPR